MEGNKLKPPGPSPAALPCPVFPNLQQEKANYHAKAIQVSTCIMHAIIPLVKSRFTVEGDSERYGYRKA